MDIRKAVVVSVVLLVIGGAVWADPGDGSEDRADHRREYSEERQDRRSNRGN